MHTLRRPKVRDQAAEQIKQFILAEKLAPGDRLPTENQLAASFGISRLTVREATKALEFLGIVESKTGVGLTVGHIDMGRVTQHLGFHPSLLRADAQQLIDSRIVIETGVLSHVARRMSDDPCIEERLRKVALDFSTARDLTTLIDLDIEFHRSLLEASGLEPLVAFGDLLQVFFRRFRESVKKAERKQGVDGHQRIVDLLVAGKVEAAARELREHIESHKERMG